MKSAPKNVRLHFYCPHGHFLSDPGLEAIIQGTVSSVIGPEAVQDYVLSKYQGRHNNMQETYESIRGMPEQYAGEWDEEFPDMRENLAQNWRRRHAAGESTIITRDEADLMSSEKKVQMDIITIRNRRFMSAPRFSSVLIELWANGFAYEDIHCSFCRATLSDTILSCLPGFGKSISNKLSYTASPINLD